jgi:hypothetical protein
MDKTIFDTSSCVRAANWLVSDAVGSRRIEGAATLWCLTCTSGAGYFINICSYTISHSENQQDLEDVAEVCATILRTFHYFQLQPEVFGCKIKRNRV